MKAQSFGKMVAFLRKKNGMTQLDLAEKMGVTDKAVSKWERDLSFPDVGSIPKLAGIFGVSVDELMLEKESLPQGKGEGISNLIQIALKGVALAMGIAVVVCSLMNRIENDTAIGLLGIGLVCLAVAQLKKEK